MLLNLPDCNSSDCQLVWNSKVKLYQCQVTFNVNLAPHHPRFVSARFRTHCEFLGSMFIIRISSKKAAKLTVPVPCGRVLFVWPRIRNCLCTRLRVSLSGRRWPNALVSLRAEYWSIATPKSGVRGDRQVGSNSNPKPHPRARTI